MRVLFILCLACLLISCGQGDLDKRVDANQNVAAPANPRSLCDLLTKAADYDGKEVEVNAILITGREATYLYDPECRGKKEKEVWYGIEDRDEGKKLDPIINPENAEYKEVGLVRVRADFRGILMVKKDKGFGHMDYYLYNLGIQQISNVTPVDRNVPYPWQ